MHIDWSDRNTHRTLNAAMNGIYGVVNMGAAAIVFTVFGAIGAICVLAGVGTLQIPAVIVGLCFGALGMGIAALVAAPFVVNVVAAYGLANHEHAAWTVVAALLSAALSVLQFPLGTALALHTGAVVFWEPLFARAR